MKIDSSSLHPGRLRALARALFAVGSVLLFGSCSLRGSGSVPSMDPALLLDPSSPALQAVAPDTFTALLETTKGEILIEVIREWAPLGADRFYNLVRAGYYNDVAFFRNIGGFMAQFGIHGDPQVTEAWRPARIQDDPVRASNTRGMISFAMAGPNTRTVQLFINHADNSRLDVQGFAPFGRVIRGLETLDALYSGYGEGAPRGQGPLQDRIQAEGNSYLRAEFPLLDYIVRARVVSESRRR